MQILELMKERHSVRKYKPVPLPEDVVDVLERRIGEINSESGLDVRLVLDDPKSFSVLGTRLTGFSNVPAYIAMVGSESEDLNEKVGYHGEQLVILAQSLGLNSCWAAMCSKRHVSQHLGEGQRMVIGIAIGYGAEQGRPHRNKPIEKLADMDGAPEWFRRGMDCVLLAPSGLNRQPFHFSLKEGKVLATCKGEGMARIDLGIARYHFEIGAGRENFIWDSERT
ncbi:MAG: nitroreductase [archaeon]|nr:nitroreductase [archaeon]